MVVGHGGEEVMGDVSVRNVMEHDVQGAVRTVHGGERAPQPVPLGVAVVRQRRVRVLQQCDAHQPGVHPQVGHHIHLPSPIKQVR